MSYQTPQDPFHSGSYVVQPPKRRRSRLLLVALLAFVLSTAIVAVGVLISKAFRDTAGVATEPAAETSFAPQPFSIRGFLTLKLGQFAWFSTDDTCYGYERFADIRSGTQVVVTDPSGTTIAMGRLRAGIPRHDPDDNTKVRECRFPIEVTGVPGVHQFYGLEIGKHGRLDFARDRIEGSLELTLK